MYPTETTNRQDAHEVAAWGHEVQIYEWMTKKLAAINQLREVLSYRQETIFLKKTGSGKSRFYHRMLL